MTKEERIVLAAELGELTLVISKKNIAHPIIMEVNKLQHRANEIATQLDADKGE